MVNQELLNFIDLHLKQGTAREQIKATLLANEWSEADVDDAFVTLSSTTTNSPLVRTMPSANHKKAILSVVVILVLVVVAYVGYSWSKRSIISSSLDSAMSQGRDARRQNDLRMIQSGVLAYYEKKGQYPNFLNELVPTFLPGIPADPKTEAQYSYTYDSAYYQICAQLESGKQMCEPSPEAVVSGSIPQISRVEYFNRSIGFKFLYPADFTLSKITKGVPYSTARGVLSDPSQSDHIALTSKDIEGVISVNIGGIGMEDENESMLSTQTVKVGDLLVSLNIYGNKNNLNEGQRAFAYFKNGVNDYSFSFFWTGESKKNVTTIKNILSSFDFSTDVSEEKETSAPIYYLYNSFSLGHFGPSEWPRITESGINKGQNIYSYDTVTREQKLLYHMDGECVGVGEGVSGFFISCKNKLFTLDPEDERIDPIIHTTFPPNLRVYSVKESIDGKRIVYLAEENGKIRFSRRNVYTGEEVDLLGSRKAGSFVGLSFADSYLKYIVLAIGNAGGDTGTGSYYLIDATNPTYIYSKAIAEYISGYGSKDVEEPHYFALNGNGFPEPRYDARNLNLTPDGRFQLVTSDGHLEWGLYPKSFVIKNTQTGKDVVLPLPTSEADKLIHFKTY